LGHAAARASKTVAVSVERLYDDHPRPDEALKRLIPGHCCREHPADWAAGVVDSRLGPQSAAVFEVLLDLCDAVMDLDRGLGPFGEDLGVRVAGVRG
jgi:hypothetical protein